MTVAIYDNEMKEASSKEGQRNENSNTRDVGHGQTGIKMRSGGQKRQAVGKFCQYIQDYYLSRRALIAAVFCWI